MTQCLHSHRTSLLLIAAGAVAACAPSATVRRTTPVANLRSYRTLMVRVSAPPRWRDYTSTLASSVAENVTRNCSFERVLTPWQRSNAAPDLILDLALNQVGRGGHGFIQNPNLATVDVTAVLSDGINNELLGSADIQGKSSAVQIANEVPENEALGAVGQRVAKILVKSGCSGPRIARAQPPAPADAGAPKQTNTTAHTQTANSAQAHAVDAAAHQRAEAVNTAGKKLFRSGNIRGAQQKFQQAMSISADPRYLFNLCLSHEALGEYDQADKSCRGVLAMHPAPYLAKKAQQRLPIIAAERKKK